MIRFIRFNVVGALGVVVQLGVVGALVHGFGLDAVVATAAGVSAAVLHNFGWHVRWTWRDRMGPGVSLWAALARFSGANGAVSLVGSVLLMRVLTGAGLPAIPANLVTIAACGGVNFFLGGRVCFPQSQTIDEKGDGSRLWKSQGTSLRPGPRTFPQSRPVPRQSSDFVENRPVPPKSRAQGERGRRPWVARA